MIKRGIFFKNPKHRTPNFNSLLLSFSYKTQHFQSPTDQSTCITLLQSCAQKNLLKRGQQLHCFMLRNGYFLPPTSTTSLINMYSKCNRMLKALSVFDTSVHEHNVFGYNAIIAGFIGNELPVCAYEFYLKMRVSYDIVPDKFTFPCVIKACSDLSKVIEVRKIHGLLFKFGLEVDLFIGSALVHSYLKFGLMEEAQEVFEELPVRDVVLWNAMINGYSQIGELDKVLEVFRMMKDDGVVPSRFTVTGILPVLAMKGEVYNGMAIHGFIVKMGYDSGNAVSNALIDLYGKCKCFDDALDIFEMMDEKDIFSWNSILCVHEQRSDHHGTLKLLKRMLLAGIRPDLVTVTTTLPACAHLTALRIGKEIHGYMITSGLGICADSHTNNAIIYMYAKCGTMREAQQAFDRMVYKDTASWNIIIMGYAMHGLSDEALNTFSRMCEAQMEPNDVTFVGVLSACSHGGLLRQGRTFFAQMQPVFGVVPTIEHYTCMIDMLGRAGQLEEAYELLTTMPVESSPVVLRAFLAACRIHGNAALAEVVVGQIHKLEPLDCGSYIIMSNVYGADGRYEDVSGIRHTMREQSIKKTPGYSWIELNNGMHYFVSGDKTHAEEDSIYTTLNSLTSRSRDYMYSDNSKLMAYWHP